VARYADTKGYVFQEERRYPFAYTYRDWVIQAFNEDMPYDQFVIRQIAADHLNEGPNSLAALGFLTLGRRFINNIHDIIDDRIDVVSRGMMGLTTTCARCHDHKFDPITQKDYYALYGVFASSTEPDLKDLPLLAGHGASPEYERERAKGEEAIRGYTHSVPWSSARWSAYNCKRRSFRAGDDRNALPIKILQPKGEGRIARVAQQARPCRDQPECATSRHGSY
jgi:hypothetical protein